MSVENGSGTTSATGGEGASGGQSAAATGVAEGAAQGAAGANPGVNQDPALTPPPAFAPNFKFKYRGIEKETESEIDDLFKPLIKDQTVEKKIRELHEKAYGLDYVKHDRDSLKERIGPLEQYQQRMNEALGLVGGYVQKDDLDSFFQAWKIPKEQVLRYALKQIQLAEMTPQDRAVYEQQRQETQRATALELQNQQLQQQFQALAVNQRETELTTVLQRPAVADAIAAFDQRAGKAGAFKNLVVQRGQWHALASGVDMPVEQVVSEVLGMIGYQSPAAGTPPAVGQPGATAPAASGTAKPVIPNIQGKGTSPAKRVPRSTDDLRKLAAGMSPTE